jgi:hypothetical protein
MKIVAQSTIKVEQSQIHIYVQLIVVYFLFNSHPLLKLKIEELDIAYLVNDL